MPSRSARYPLRKARLNRMRKASDGRQRLAARIRRSDHAARRPNVPSRTPARYIQKLPKNEQDLPHWPTATLTLINTAEGRDFLFHANAAMPQALNHGNAAPAPATALRRKTAKAFKIVE